MKFDPNNVSESLECIVVCEWVKLQPRIWEMFFSIPNQAICYTNPGVRKKMGKEGVKAGLPDYCLAIPNDKYHGLFLEMKKKSEKGKSLRIEQEEWRNKLNAKGYKSIVCYGADEAIKEISEYLAGVPSPDYNVCANSCPGVANP